MHRDLQDTLSQFDPNRPLEQAQTIPSSWYFDEDVFELEQRAVFGDSFEDPQIAFGALLERGHCVQYMNTASPSE